MPWKAQQPSAIGSVMKRELNPHKCWTLPKSIFTGTESR